MDVTCSRCATRLRIPEGSAGRRFRCRRCGAPVDAPADEPEAIPDAEAPPVAAPTAPPPPLERTCAACGARYPRSRSRCPRCGEDRRAARDRREEERTEVSTERFERAAPRMGVLAGLGMIVVAVVWFWWGWSEGTVFLYPPILAGLGLLAVLRGLIGDDGADERDPPGTRRGRRPRRRA